MNPDKDYKESRGWYNHAADAIAAVSSRELLRRIDLSVVSQRRLVFEGQTAFRIRIIEEQTCVQCHTEVATEQGGTSMARTPTVADSTVVTVDDGTHVYGQ